MDPRQTGRSVHRTSETGDGTPGFDLSARHSLLLECLSEHGGQVGLVELSRAFAARMHGCQSSSIPDSLVRRYYIEISRTIIDHLEREGLVDYCEEEGTVRSTV
ncbi:MAG: hypothetical protein V5A55_07785 [Halovenus sp.]